MSLGRPVSSVPQDGMKITQDGALLIANLFSELRSEKTLVSCIFPTPLKPSS